MVSKQLVLYGGVAASILYSAGKLYQNVINSTEYTLLCFQLWVPTQASSLDSALVLFEPESELFCALYNPTWTKSLKLPNKPSSLVSAYGRADVSMSCICMYTI